MCYKCPSGKYGCADCEPWFCTRDENKFIYCYTEYYPCSCNSECGEMNTRKVYGFVSPEEIAAHPEKVDAAYAARKAHIERMIAELIGQHLPVLHEALADLPTFSEDDGKKLVAHANELLNTIRNTTDKRAAKAALDELRRLFNDNVRMIDHFSLMYKHLYNVIRNLRLKNTNPYCSNETISPEVADECARAQNAHDDKAFNAVYTAATTACEKIRDLYYVAAAVYAQRRWELRRWRVWKAVSGLFASAA